MKTQFSVIFLAFLTFVLLFSSSYLALQNTQIKKEIKTLVRPSIPTSVPNPPGDGNGQFCGGIAGMDCPHGYNCQLDGNYPDAGGTCVPQGIDFTCPPSGWVDCMPGPDRKNEAQCSQEGMTWYEANCPDFQGGAY